MAAVASSRFFIGDPPWIPDAREGHLCMQTGNSSTQQRREVCRKILVKQYSHPPQQFRKLRRALLWQIRALPVDTSRNPNEYVCTLLGKARDFNTLSREELIDGFDWGDQTYHARVRADERDKPILSGGVISDQIEPGRRS